MKMLLRIGGIVLVLAVLGVGLYLYSQGGWPFAAAAASDQTVASGFIEGDQVNITAETGGRIQAITVGEGDRVTAGQEIVRLDRSLVDAQLAQAQAAVDTAQAQLALIKNGPRASDVTAAQAALTAAQRNYDTLRAGATASDLASAQSALAAARQNYDQVRAGPSADQLAQLKAQVDNAQAALDQAQAAYDKIGGATNPFIAETPQARQLQEGTNNYHAAAAAYNDARTHPTAAELAAAQSQVQQAQAALARLTPDQAQLAAAQSQVEQAQAALDRLSPTAEALAVAEAQVREAQAALAVLRVQASQLTLTSPVSGTVALRAAQVGELAAPGEALLTITTLDPVKLTIYVPETRLGQIKLGDHIGVQVDSFPDQVFQGQVIFISPQAEFTPRNVQTKAERVNTVFAVKLEIPNADSALKPGMPADATLE